MSPRFIIFRMGAVVNGSKMEIIREPYFSGSSEFRTKMYFKVIRAESKLRIKSLAESQDSM